MSRTDADGGRGCLKTGCLGCGGLGVLVIAIAVIVAGVAAMQVRNERIETPSTTRPATVASDDPAATGGRVALRVASGELKVVPADPGEPLSIDARYDAESYRLDERFEEGDGSWSYELEFGHTGGGFMRILRQIFGGTSPSVTVRLPRDTPLDLELDVYRAGGAAELGGLWLRSTTIDTEQGGFFLEVSDPLREPMESLTIATRMGGLALEEVGNASPRRIDVQCSMGGLNLDLDGRWLNDADVSIDVSRGEVNLELPRDVHVEGLGARDRGIGLRGSADEVPAPTLRFQTNTGQSGEIAVSGTSVSDGL